MKPRCKPCEEKGKETFSSVFGEELTEKVLYRLFNPNGEPYEKSLQNVDVEGLIQELTGNSLDEEIEHEAEDYVRDWIRRDDRKWVHDYMKQKRARQRAWKQLVEKVKEGELQPSDFSAEQLIQNFPDQVVDELTEEDFLTQHYSSNLYKPQNVLAVYPEFTEKSEEVIAKKVLEEVFVNLEKFYRGSHEIQESGLGIVPSGTLQEFDELQHAYDMLDIQESLINTAVRDPVNLKISNEDLKARIPRHETKSSNVILIDSSYSMRGDKFKGAILAALAFRELLQREYREDKLLIVAYNQKPQLLPSGHIVRLRPYGYTDIGQALDFSTELLSKEEGNRNIFLLTDGEPTATYQHGQTPEESTLKAAYLAGKADVSLNIIMLDRRPELKRICEKMARLNGNALITYVENPLNLKEFVIKSFMDYKKIRHYACS